MDYKKEIIKGLISISGKYNIATIYFDWIHLIAYSISSSLDRSQDRNQEAAYRNVEKKYTEEEFRIFMECYLMLILAIESKSSDWLGEIYGLAENTRDFNHGMNRLQL